MFSAVQSSVPLGIRGVILEKGDHKEVILPHLGFADILEIEAPRFFLAQ